MHINDKLNEFSGYTARLWEYRATFSLLRIRLMSMSEKPDYELVFGLTRKIDIPCQWLVSDLKIHLNEDGRGVITDGDFSIVSDSDIYLAPIDCEDSDHFYLLKDHKLIST